MCVDFFKFRNPDYQLEGNFLGLLSTDAAKRRSIYQISNESCKLAVGSLPHKISSASETGLVRTSQGHTGVRCLKVHRAVIGQLP